LRPLIVMKRAAARSSLLHSFLPARLPKWSTR
jgi:hypothetical protein